MTKYKTALFSEIFEWDVDGIPGPPPPALLFLREELFDLDDEKHHARSAARPNWPRHKQTKKLREVPIFSANDLSATDEGDEIFVNMPNGFSVRFNRGEGIGFIVDHVTKVINEQVARLTSAVKSKDREINDLKNRLSDQESRYHKVIQSYVAAHNDCRRRLKQLRKIGGMKKLRKLLEETVEYRWMIKCPKCGFRPDPHEGVIEGMSCVMSDCDGIYERFEL